MTSMTNMRITPYIRAALYSLGSTSMQSSLYLHDSLGQTGQVYDSLY